MSRFIPRFAGSLLISSALSASAGAQAAAPVLDRLASPIDSIRAHAFYELSASARSAEGSRNGAPWTAALAERAKNDQQLGRAIIALLHRENELMIASPSRAAAIDMDYRIDLAVTVARMRDPASVSDLMVWVSIGGSVADALTSFGEVSVSGLLTELRRPEVTHRMSAALVLERIASDSVKSISGSARAAMRTGLVQLLAGEPEVRVRVGAVLALATFSDDDVRRTMERLAVSDPGTEPWPTNAVRYPVREAANAWLAKHLK